MENFKKSIGDQIRDARKAKGLTQKELGEMLRIGEPTVNKYESGKQNPTVETLFKIAEALNLKLKISLE